MVNVIIVVYFVFFKRYMENLLIFFIYFLECGFLLCIVFWGFCIECLSCYGVVFYDGEFLFDFSVY